MCIGVDLHRKRRELVAMDEEGDVLVTRSLTSRAVGRRPVLGARV